MAHSAPSPGPVESGPKLIRENIQEPAQTILLSRVDINFTWVHQTWQM